MRFCNRKPDLVIEVAHPDITKEFGAKVLQVSDYMVMYFIYFFVFHLLR